VTENLVLAAAMAVMALIPVLEIVLRATLGFGIAGAASFTQHFVLIVGMLGAAIAAREGRLISLAALPTLIGGRAAAAARTFAGAVAVMVSALLCAASLQFSSLKFKFQLEPGRFGFSSLSAKAFNILKLVFGVMEVYF
jgi:TRAP-type C4-dicarboxylate transport system permease small subunit